MSIEFDATPSSFNFLFSSDIWFPTDLYQVLLVWVQQFQQEFSIALESQATDKSVKRNENKKKKQYDDIQMILHKRSTNI